MAEQEQAPLSQQAGDAQSAGVAKPSSVDSARQGKQAIILVHGMGEQIPMDTLRGFVKTVWEDDPDIAAKGLPNPSKVWSKPDNRTGSLELRRITTRGSVASKSFPGGVRSDFYELYWADLSAGSTWAQFVNWVRHLLFRPWSRVPPDVRSGWCLLLVASIMVVLLGAMGLIPETLWKAHMPARLDQKLVVALCAALGVGLHYVATRSFGRVVRYTRADPENIAARAAIRERGLNLLRALHRDPSYSRIILVGHSLGTILAYDLLSYFWAEQTDARTISTTGPAFAALCSLERAAGALEANSDPTAIAAYDAAQRALREAIAERQSGAPTSGPQARWLVTDLVTLGSPLAHADFLLASGRDDLQMRQEGREFPIAPPYREPLDPNVLVAAQATGLLPTEAGPSQPRLMSFPLSLGSDHWQLHHAAPFALVRWTNLHDPSRFVFLGDMIGGPVAPIFGPTAKDVDLSKLDGPSRRFTHTRYWDPSASSVRLTAIRRAINLLDS